MPPTAASPKRGMNKAEDGSVWRYETVCTLMRKELS
jgi:hypothetical protein